MVMLQGCNGTSDSPLGVFLSVDTLQVDEGHRHLSPDALAGDTYLTAENLALLYSSHPWTSAIFLAVGSP